MVKYDNNLIKLADTIIILLNILKENEFPFEEYKESKKNG
jgi:hypothetical protein